MKICHGLKARTGDWPCGCWNCGRGGIIHDAVVLMHSDAPIPKKELLIPFSGRVWMFILTRLLYLYYLSPVFDWQIGRRLRRSADAGPVNSSQNLAQARTFSSCSRSASVYWHTISFLCSYIVGASDRLGDMSQNLNAKEAPGVRPVCSQGMTIEDYLRLPLRSLKKQTCIDSGKWQGHELCQSTLLYHTNSHFNDPDWARVPLCCSFTCKERNHGVL